MCTVTIEMYRVLHAEISKYFCSWFRTNCSTAPNWIRNDNLIKLVGLYLAAATNFNQNHRIQCYLWWFRQFTLCHQAVQVCSSISAVTFHNIIDRRAKKKKEYRPTLKVFISLLCVNRAIIVIKVFIHSFKLLTGMMMIKSKMIEKIKL